MGLTLGSGNRVVYIMQPYFFPYMGYFQLIGASDVFVLYDNIKYTKRGWINRNKIAKNGHEIIPLVLPVARDSDYLDVVERRISDVFDPAKMLRVIHDTYRHAPHFDPTFELLEGVLNYDSRNLYEFLRNSISKVAEAIGIQTQILTSSCVPADHSLRGSDRVKAIAQALRGDVYLNPIGGTQLYSAENFQAISLDLQFLRTKPFEYGRGKYDCVSGLSIIDQMMYISESELKKIVRSNFDLLRGDDLGAS